MTTDDDNNNNNNNNQNPHNWNNRKPSDYQSPPPTNSLLAHAIAAQRLANGTTQDTNVDLIRRIQSGLDRLDNGGSIAGVRAGARVGDQDRSLIRILDDAIQLGDRQRSPSSSAAASSDQDTRRPPAPRGHPGSDGSPQVRNMRMLRDDVDSPPRDKTSNGQ
jgi:hypothetical protein